MELQLLLDLSMEVSPLGRSDSNQRPQPFHSGWTSQGASGKRHLQALLLLAVLLVMVQLSDGD